MNSNRYQNNRNNNFRSGDNRRGLPNGGRSGGWGDRSNNNNNRPQYEWRSDRDSKDRRSAYKNENRDHSVSVPTTHLPGIRVNPNQSSTPFVSSESKLNNCANGSGDQICRKTAANVESISEKLSQMDIKVKESETPIKTEVTSSVDTKEAPNDSVAKEWTDSSGLKTTESDPKIDENVANNKPGYDKRRNTIGSDYKLQNFRTFRRNDWQRSGQKFERFPNYNNRIPATDPNKRFNRSPKYSPTKNDYHFGNYMPLNPYLSNMYDPINAFPQLFWQNQYYPNYYYGIPSPLMGPNSGEMVSELSNGSQRMQNESDRNTKIPEQSTQTGINHLFKLNLKNNELSDLSGFGAPTQFLPFKPTPECPVPPIYYGNVKRYNSDNGFTYYFESVFPPGIWPLALEVDPNGGPILPSNCRQLCLT